MEEANFMKCDISREERRETLHDCQYLCALPRLGSHYDVDDFHAEMNTWKFAIAQMSVVKNETAFAKLIFYT